MKTYITILILLFCVQIEFANAQQNLPIGEVKNISNQNIEGTYQIQVINSRDQPYIPANLTQLVLNNRHATDVVKQMIGLNYTSFKRCVELYIPTLND